MDSRSSAAIGPILALHGWMLSRHGFGAEYSAMTFDISLQFASLPPSFGHYFDLHGVVPGVSPDEQLPGNSRGRHLKATLPGVLHHDVERAAARG
jgi:hypothetical protein